MKKLRITLIAILGVGIFLWQGLPAYAAGLSTVEVTNPTITVPLNTWNELKVNNEKALNIIRQSRVPLTEAQALTVKQANELQELKSINNEQAKALSKAQRDLTMQQQSLKEMNNSLEMLSKDIKRNQATEERLHRQRNTWALISGLLLVGLVLK